MGEPAQSVFYRVTLDGFISLGLWTKIEGLSFEHEVKEYREGGVNGYTRKIIGPVKYGNLRLTRPVDADSMFISIWLASRSHQDHPPDDGHHGAQLRGLRDPTWNLLGVVPVKWWPDARHHEQRPRHRDAGDRLRAGRSGSAPSSAAIGGAMTASASVSF